MCTVLVAWRWRAGEPPVVAANRDEALDRPSDPPMRLADDPAVWGGRDRLAGGTWLAVDPAAARLCAVTNRHLPGVEPARDPALRSRGEIPLRALSGEPIDLAAYNPVNVVLVAADEAWWAAPGAGGGPLEPGVHVLGVTDLDDRPRALAAARAAAADARDAADLRDRFTAILASHQGELDGTGEPPPCIHGDEYGTVSSSSVVLRPGAVEMTFAAGRPCVTPYRPVVLETARRR